MGAHHARTLKTEVAGAEVTAISDTDTERANSLAQELGVASVHADGYALIQNRNVDAVLIASPDATHTPLSLACIAAGKPVLCEKPLGVTAEECKQIIAAETAAKRRFVQVGFMRRFDPGYRDMRNALNAGRYGPALFLHCVHRNQFAPHYITSDLVIANSVVHEIDIARFVLDDDFAAATVVSPRATSKAPARQPQLVILETESGVVVDVEAFVDAQYGYEVRAELVCEEGTISLQPSPPTFTRHAGAEGFPVHSNWVPRFMDAYRILLQSWVRGIEGGTLPRASAWDGYMAQKTADHCLAALRSREKVKIKREDAPDLYRE